MAEHREAEPPAPRSPENPDALQVQVAPCSPYLRRYIQFDTNKVPKFLMKIWMMLRYTFTEDAWLKFRLLMWKNYLQQWRHRKQTVAEILIPVFTMMLVLIIRCVVEPAYQATLTYPSLGAYSLGLSRDVLYGMHLSSFTIAYSPTSPILEEVMTSAMTALFKENEAIFNPLFQRQFLKNHPFLRKWYGRSSFQVKAFNNSKNMRSLYAEEKNTRIVIAAVEFEDQLFEAKELPKTNLSYSLRFPERPRLNSFYQNGGRFWKTDKIFPSYELPGPRWPDSYEGGWDPGYVNELFIAVQQAVSIELISKLTGKNIYSTVRVNIQRYPHPYYWDDKSLTVLKVLFPMFIMLSSTYTAINIVRAIVVEKELQLKETMKIMGLPTWLHWTAWFWKQFIFQILVATLMVILLKVHWFSTSDGYSNYAVFTHTPWTVLMFFLLLYLSCMIFFCFMLSGFFSKGSSAALFTGVIWFLTFMPAFLLTSDSDISMTGQILSCLIVNTAMPLGFQLILTHECSGGLQWGHFMSSPVTDSSRFMFGHVVFMLFVDCVLYMLITLYLEQINPGPFGTRRPWYFIFQSDYWSPDRNPAVNTPRDNLPIQNINNDNVVHEQDPENHTIGVKIHNLTKVYGDQIVVNNLNLNIYNDQITVLLGHNGAGKSTTISMLTGNIKATGGEVTVAGYDMSKQAADARSHIGLCLQHNVLFDDLTVREHLEFFSRLKGLTGTELKTDIDTLVKKLELEPKRDYPSKGLSGGQKRRLCVGIALSGKARVVFLDEPTSGMDPASRRGLWELLQKEKKGRTMILTTHFMDEADILGDRVAIMAQGTLQCIGSPYFLKRHYGMGYSLVVVKDTDFNAERCTEVINKYIPGSVVKEDSGSEVTYSLPNDFSHKFEEMLNDLEKNNGNIKFKNYGLVATTLEDVFMSVGADLEPVDMNRNVEDAEELEFIDTSIKQFDKSSSVTGYPLLIQRVLAVWLKLALVWSRSWWLILQFVVPFLLLTVSLGVLEYAMALDPSNPKLMLTLTKGYTQTESLVSNTGTAELSNLVAKAYQTIFKTSGSMKLTSIGEKPIDEYYLSRTKDPLAMGILRHQLLIGSTFSDGSATAWYSNFGYHDVAISLAYVHRAILKAHSPESELIVYNHPLEATYADQTDMQMIISMISMQLSTGIGASLATITAVYVMFYIKERVSGAKLLQKSAGLQPALLWGGAALFDWIWFLIFCLPILFCFIIFNVAGLSSASELARVCLCLMVYAAAMMPLTYLLSLVFNGPALGFVSYFFLNMLLGMLGAQIVESLMAPTLNAKSTANSMDSILQFHPLYCLVTAVRYLNQIGLREQRCFQLCEYYEIVYPGFQCTMGTLCTVDDNCCIPSNPHFKWAEPGVLRYIVLMFITGILLWILLMVLEYGLIKQLWTKKKTPPPLDESTLDEDVVAEEKHAREVHQSGRDKQALLAVALSKYYGNYLAVNQISFCVNEYECFGLLGVNGAGKTSTFKMLMGDETISSGEAFVSGHSVEKSLYKVHENTAYCPQFDALFMELTGHETLRVFALMRGLRHNSVTHIANAFSNALGFRRHLDKRVYQYSGGTRRKLNTAVAFLGKTRIVYIDEPTTGVDVAAKRHVWRAVRGVQRAGRGVVLTSHSMEECEALCSRLTIMVNGRFKCLGTPQHLKNKFSEGFTLTIKLKADENEESGLASATRVKEYVEKNFKDPRLMEEYQGLLTYYLPDRSMAWSHMFGIMERAKKDLEVETYLISQTTLEQIFLQFTKYQGHMPTAESGMSSKTLTEPPREPPDPKPEIAQSSKSYKPNPKEK